MRVYFSLCYFRGSAPPAINTDRIESNAGVTMCHMNIK